MAGKEYSMLFKLQATVGGEFTKAFSSADKTMQSTQNEIRALNQIQSDITAYQKQQTAVENTNRKLKDLQSQYDNIQREYEETGESSSALANKMIDKQRQIDNTSASLEKQTGKLDALEHELQEAGVDTSNLGQESEKLKAKMNDLGDEMVELNEKGSGGFQALGDALVAAGIIEGVKKLAEAYRECLAEAQAFADEVMTVSEQYGIAADNLQAIYYAAELVDVSTETLTSSMAKNVKSMGAYQQGTKKTVEAYDELGVTVTNVDGSLRDGEEVYWEVIDALGRMTNETERDVLAQTLLGRSAMQLNPLIAAGSAAMNEYAAQAQKAGYILSDDMIRNLAALDDAEKIQKNNLTALKNTLATAFAPELTKLSLSIGNVLGDVTTFLQKHPGVMKAMIAITAELGAFAAAYAVYNAAKKASATLSAIKTALNITEKASQDALNASILANPYVAAAAAVVVLTAAIVALVSAQDEATKEYRELSYESREEFDALQAKKQAYEEAVELYGETSEEAAYLAWEVDELTESYESNRQTFEELIAAHDEAIGNINDTTESIREQFDAVDQENVKVQALASKLDDLASSSGGAAASQRDIINIINALNAALPGLGLTYDKVVNSAGSIGDTVGNWNKANVALARYRVAQQNISDATQNSIVAQTELAAVMDELAVAERKRNEAAKAYNELVPDGEDNFATLFAGLLTPEYQALSDAQKRYEELQVKAEEAQKAANDADAVYKECAETLETFGYAADGVTQAETDLNSVIGRTVAQVDELVEKYNEAYTAAYDSISGQYDLWDTAAEESAIATSTITANLADQEEYWANYNANLQNLSARTAEVEGLSDVIASFADGSAESVNAIAGMAAASDEELQAMVAQYQSLKQQQEETSASLAELSTNFQTEMDTLLAEFTTDVEGLNLSAEAADNGIATIQGWIDGAEGLRSNVQSEYDSLGQAAIAALKARVESATVTATVQVVASAANAYASGTDYAQAGLALVGEEGPEFVRFRGGEQVIPAAKTAEMMRGNVSINVAPSINISGGVSESTASVLADAIVEQVMDALDSAGIDASRRAYR